MKFIIITVCFNDFAGLKRTYDSLVDQNAEYLWVVVDGGSSDGTYAWLATLQRSLRNKLMFVSEADQGIYDAMNKGIDLAANFPDHYFTLFLNAGDCLYGKNVLNSVSGRSIIAGRKKADVIMGASLRVYPSGVEKVRKSRPFDFVRYGMPVEHQALFVVNRLVQMHRFSPEFSFSGDYNFLHDLYMDKSVKAVVIDDLVCRFFADGVSEKKRLHGIFEDFTIRRNFGLISIVSNIFMVSVSLALKLRSDIFDRN